MSSSSPPVPDTVRIYGNDIYSFFGRNVVDQFTKHNVPENYPFPIPRPPQSSGTSSKIPVTGATLSGSLVGPRGSHPSRHQGSPTVGILGAGPGGLYTALMLDSMDIPFKIIEGRDRVGGRLYTHTFHYREGRDLAPFSVEVLGSEKYFDVGAMRFPDIEAMGRFWDLVRNHDLGIDRLIRPYYFDDLKGNSLLSFNNRNVRQSAVTPETEDARLNLSSIIHDTPEPQRWAYIRAREAIMNDVVKGFATRLFKDLHNGKQWGRGWDHLMKHDHLSVRAFLSTTYKPSKEVLDEYPEIPHGPLPTDVINWYETRGSSTGSYDQSLTDFILGRIAFGWRPSLDDEGNIIAVDNSADVKSYRIDGGAERLAESIEGYLRTKRNHRNDFSFKKRVTGIRRVTDENGKEKVEVTIKCEEDPHSFTHVISTIPLPVLRTIDLTSAGLTEVQSTALRQLTYAPATKIGLWFRNAWWTNGGHLRDKAGFPLNLGIVGGQTYTDSPLYTVVYPSSDHVGQCLRMTTTLIASYCWADDAQRLAGLIAEDDDDGLIELTLRELARIHSISLGDLRRDLISSFAYDWTTDIYSMGAFAHFGPGKFKSLYTSLTGSGSGSGELTDRIFFAGEALSVRHAWVEGALGSAWRAVYMLLHSLGSSKETLKKFFKKWGMDGEWYQQLPPLTPEYKEQHGTPGYYSISVDDAMNVEHDLLLKYLVTARHINQQPK